MRGGGKELLAVGRGWPRNGLADGKLAGRSSRDKERHDVVCLKPTVDLATEYPARTVADEQHWQPKRESNCVSPRNDTASP